jgi:hypothetical protein
MVFQVIGCTNSASYSFLPHLSRRYLEASRCASRPRVSSFNLPELVPHLDVWKDSRPCQFLIASYPATFRFRCNPKVC